MKKWLQIFFGILLVVLFVEILLIAPSDLEKIKENESPSVSVNDLADKRGEQLMRGVHLVESREGRKDWELWSETATGTREQGKGSWKLEQVKVAFFTDSGDTFIVTGTEGTIDVLTKDMEIRGKVVMKSTNGYEFYSEIIIYSAQTRVLTCPQKVNMLGAKVEGGRSLDLTGGDLVAELTDNKIVISKGVKGYKRVQPQKVVHINSKKAEFSGKSNYARFYESVILDVENYRITGPVATFSYNEGTGEVESLLVKGGVKVSDIDKWAVSNEVSVEFISNQFIFRGEPRVVQNTDELRGEEIIFLDGGKRIKVNRARARVDESKTERSN